VNLSLEGYVLFAHQRLLLCLVGGKCHAGAAWAVLLGVVEGVVVCVFASLVSVLVSGGCWTIYVEIIVIGVRIISSTIILFLSGLALIILAINSNETLDFLLKTSDLGLIILVLFCHVLFLHSILDLSVCYDTEILVILK
jgi:hypothetical protein